MFVYIILVCIIAILYYLMDIQQKRKNLPPGPYPLPIVGNMLLFFDKSINPVSQMIKLKEQYGAIYTIWLGNLPAIIVTDYDRIIDLFVKDGALYTGRLRNYFIDTIRYGNCGIVFSEGDLWKEQRRFSLHTLRDFGFGRNLMELKVMDEVYALLDRIDQKKSNKFEIKKELEICIGSIINSVLFGYRFANEKLDEFYYFKRLLDGFVADSSIAIFALMNAFTRRMPILSKKWKKSADVIEQIYSFLSKNLKEHEENFDAINSDEPTDFVYAYLHEIERRKSAGESIDNYSYIQLRNVCLDLWIAGLETTVTTLTWGMLYMLRYPQVQQRVRDEIESVVGHDRHVAMADKANLTYTTAVIQEIQRVANILSFNVWHRTTDTTIIDGYKIASGTLISPQISVVMRDERYFPNADQFNPDRFIDDKDGSLKKCDQLIPFGVGKRQCLGESLARMELFLVFANLMQRYTFTVPDDEQMPSERPKSMGVVNQPETYYVSCDVGS